MPSRFPVRHAFAILGLSLLVLGPAHDARAATLTVIGDVNSGGGSNLTLYSNVLGAARKVLVARSTGSLSGVFDHFGTLGAQVSVLQGALTDAKLSSVGLLVFTATYNAPLVFAEPELAAARHHAEIGGNIMMVLESPSAARLAEYNAVIAGLGGRIRFSGERFRSTEEIGELPDSGLTVGAPVFQLSPYNTLTGGAPVLVASNGVAIATEVLGAPAPVPVPPAFPLMAGALMVLGVLRKMRVRG